MTLDTPATLAALHRTNAIAKVRRLALSTIEREAKSASSLEGLRTIIEKALSDLAIIERDAISKA
jgi:hypothetical protein